jgi:hypothetical protein
MVNLVPPKNSKQKSRWRYEKGWYYENEAKKIIYNQLYSNGLKGFLIKAPYSYPFDLIVFCIPNYIMFWEIRYTNKNTVYVPKRKIEKTKQKIKGYNGFVFKYYVLAMFGSKYNYKIFEINLAERPRDYLFKKE